VVGSTPRPHFTPGKNLIPIIQEAGWATGAVWTGGKTRPHRDSIPDRPARSQSLYRLSYPAHMHKRQGFKFLTSRVSQAGVFHGDAVRCDMLFFGRWKRQGEFMV